MSNSQDLQISKEQLKRLVESLEPNSKVLKEWVEDKSDEEEELTPPETESGAPGFEEEDSGEETTQEEVSAIDDLVSEENFHKFEDEVSPGEQDYNFQSYIRWQDAWQTNVWELQGIRYFQKLYDFLEEYIKLRYMEEIKEQMYSNYKS